MSSGLIYLRNRYYDPSVGRFISEDPIRSGSNWYTYCSSNPINFTDSTGLDEKLDAWVNERYSGKPNVTFVVDRPVPNSRQAIDSNFSGDVGHTFIRLDFGDGRVIYKGFWPPVEGMTTKQILNQDDVVGRLNDDSGHEWDIAKTYEISGDQANNILSFIEGYGENYNMVSNNCTTWAVDALAAGGITAPTSEHKWTLPDNAKQTIVDNLPWAVPFKKSLAQGKIDSLYGYTPADAAQDIKVVGGGFVVNYNNKLTTYYYH